MGRYEGVVLVVRRVFPDRGEDGSTEEDVLLCCYLKVLLHAPHPHYLYSGLCRLQGTEITEPEVFGEERGRGDPGTQSQYRES